VGTGREDQEGCCRQGNRKAYGQPRCPTSGYRYYFPSTAARWNIDCCSILLSFFVAVDVAVAVAAVAVGIAFVVAAVVGVAVVAVVAYDET